MNNLQSGIPQFLLSAGISPTSGQFDGGHSDNDFPGMRVLHTLDPLAKYSTMTLLFASAAATAIKQHITRNAKSKCKIPLKLIIQIIFPFSITLTLHISLICFVILFKTVLNNKWTNAAPFIQKANNFKTLSLSICKLTSFVWVIRAEILLHFFLAVKFCVFASDNRNYMKIHQFLCIR